MHQFLILALFFLRGARHDRNQLPDTELVQRYKSRNDQQAVATLYQRYAHLIFGVCMKYLKEEDTAKDAAMEVYEKMLKELKKHEVDNFKSWLYSLTKNLCLMQLRSEKSAGNREEGYRNFVQEFMETGEALHLFSENGTEDLLKHLEPAIANLKEEQQQCIRLFYLEERSYQEVADATGFELKKVKSYIQNGKRNLKIYLEQYKQHE